jgi:hypothetical protein
LHFIFKQSPSQTSCHTSRSAQQPAGCQPSLSHGPQQQQKGSAISAVAI